MFPSIDPAEVGVSGLFWLFLSYGYILYWSSGLISEGSDLLLLVPSMAGLVGGVVLPVLGAVPDGAIMLFSGLGSLDKAQETLSVGVGALAGSTIMLMTIPWALSIFSGRVDMRPDRHGGMPHYLGKPKLTPNLSIADTLTKTGVAITTEVKHGGLIMIVTSIPYFMIQVPGMFIHGPTEVVAEGEKYWALAGLCVCLIGFVSYLSYQFRKSGESLARLRRVEFMKEMLRKGKVSLSGAFYDVVKHQHPSKDAVGSGGGAAKYQSIEGSLDLTPTPEVKEYLQEVLADAFAVYDTNRNKTLEKKEFYLFLRDFNEAITEETLEELFKNVDSDGDGIIDFNEFIGACYRLIMLSDERAVSSAKKFHDTEQAIAQDVFGATDEEGGEEEEDIPTDISDLSPGEQQRVIKRRAFTMLAVGTILAVTFSDPFVNVLDEVATRIGISSFYVAFVLAPLGSNASELLASQYYAAKKTRKTITVSLTSLEGAGAMSNTFCLSIFMGLVFFRGLAWQYTAETLTIVLVEYIVGLSAQRNKMSTLQGFCVLLIYPLSIALVATLEAFGIN